VSPFANEDALDRTAERLKGRPQVLDRRCEIVEHPFGCIKQWINPGAFPMRGLENVRATVRPDRAIQFLNKACGGISIVNDLGVEYTASARLRRTKSKRLRRRALCLRRYPSPKAPDWVVARAVCCAEAAGYVFRSSDDFILISSLILAICLLGAMIESRSRFLKDDVSPRGRNGSGGRRDEYEGPFVDASRW
jgi:hypothetical protein